MDPLGEGLPLTIVPLSRARAALRCTPAQLDISTAQRVHVPNIWVLGFGVVAILVLVLGKYVIVRYLDP